MSGLELFGYLGSVLVAISLMMANIKKLRWINLVGALIFTIYGALIAAYPVMVLNGWIALTNVYFLRKIYRFKDKFDTLHFSAGGNELIDIFVASYSQDIKNYFPNFSAEMTKHESIVILRNLQPVGLFIMAEREPGCWEVLLDYATPDVRDLKNGEFLFNKRLGLLTEKGIAKLTTSTQHSKHQAYLQKVGFTRENDQTYTKVL